MNREELEKMFDNMLSSLDWDIEYWELKLRNTSDTKAYFFDTIIPEVLKSIKEDFKNPEWKYMVVPYEWITAQINRKAKEQFNINL